MLSYFSSDPAVLPRRGKQLSEVTAEVLLLAVDSSECPRNGMKAGRSQR